MCTALVPATVPRSLQLPAVKCSQQQNSQNCSLSRIPTTVRFTNVPVIVNSTVNDAIWQRVNRT